MKEIKKRSDNIKTTNTDALLAFANKYGYDVPDLSLLKEEREGGDGMVFLSFVYFFIYFFSMFFIYFFS